jgi:hypothetical protein
MACGGLFANGDEAFNPHRWATETRRKYFTVAGAIEKRRVAPGGDGADAILPGICLSKA